MTSHSFDTPGFKRLRLLLAMSLVLGLLIPIALYNRSTYASSVTSAAFTAGGVLVGTTRYAKNGDTVTLTVNTSNGGGSNATKCVKVTGAHTGQQTNNQSQANWTFSFTAGAGNGVQSVTVTAYSNQSCTADAGTGTASYILDNTGPTVTGALAPAPNAAGWNKGNVTVSWTGNDGTGVGVDLATVTASSTVSTDTAGQLVTGSAKDKLGNQGSSSTVTVKRDTALPSISGSRSPAANANGWNNTDVTVSFTCTDGLSGIKTCPGSTVLSGNAANQSVPGTAVDVADNSASTTVSGINIDKVAPTLSGAPTTSPNAVGWYNGNVTIHWTASDALSGLVGSAPADSTISGEGSGLTASASVSDKAGNTTSAVSSPAVNIDKTAPNTTASAPPAWNNTDVTVSLNADDALSGVKATYFTLDGGAQQTGTSVAISVEGIHTVQFWSEDKAGNTEGTKTVQVKIDKTSPTISHTQAPAANANGWNNTNVTVTFVCNDSLSGIASCTGPQTVTTEGQSQPVTGTAHDNAGNTATDPATVSIDKTAPTISTSRSPEANANGWNNTDVTVEFTCADSLSGTNLCPGAQTKGEGANQSASGTVADAAGNSASATLSGINVDKTDPALSGAATTAPNANGWYNADVAVAWSCSDGLSGIDGACPANSTVTGEGASLSATRSVSDKAGNRTTTTVADIRIDRTAPSTSANNVPSGWQNNDVTISLSANDNLSGVNATYFKVDSGTQQTGNTVTISTDGVHTIQYASIDDAGNGEVWKSVQVMLDKSSPTINHTQTPAANANGWNNSDVNVSFNCADQPTLSGLASCTSSQTVATEGEHQPVIGTATDNAGNSVQDPATVSIDKTAPTISAAADRAANANGWYKDDVTVSFTCVDSLSGIDTCTVPKMLGEGGSQSASGTVVDAAGNSASATLSGINVDKTAPYLGAAPTTLPSADSWYNTDVTMTWTCGDELSGIAGSCPADSVIGGEGEGLFVSASIGDKAGNVTTTDSPVIKIDRESPSTDVSAPSAWTNNNVTVSLSPNDALSGVKATYYILDNGAQQTGTSIPISAEGNHSLKFWSVDKANNAEATKTIQVKVDKTAPTISHTQAPVANGNGWNNVNVTVTFLCDDPLSGIASCTSPQTVTTEGQDQTVTGTAVDNAGNSQADPASVSVDKTAPTISAVADRDANANGWYSDDVSVKFTCADSLSGIGTCPVTQTFVEGANQTASGIATDAAGNSASKSIAGINVDKTAPTLSGAPTAAANADGWYNGNVTIAWTCGDALSSVDGACPANSTIASEGSGLVASASVKDKAGNQTNSDSAPVNVDRTTPSTSATAPSGWNNHDVAISLIAEDGLSGVKATYYKLDDGDQQTGISIAINTDGIHTLQFASIDRAGNMEATQSITVKIDKTVPTISHAQAPAANANGWNNSDVTVTFTCADSVSGIANCPAAKTVASEGPNQPVAGTAEDNAGNSATSVAEVSIDKTAPTISASRSPAANSFGWNNTNVTVSFTCNDTLSGVDFCPAAKTLAEGANQSASSSVSDAAGNSASASVGDINVDKTAPTLSGVPTTEPNGAGWYNDDVVIHWTASDALSGIDPITAPADSTIGGEGTGLLANASVSDKAGNEKTANSAPVQIDRTAPSTDVSAPSDWINNSVTLSLNVNDSLSGVNATYYKLDGGDVQAGTSVAISAEGIHTLKFWSVDNAGNVEDMKSAQVKIDKTLPTISHTQAPVANAKGWNTTTVTVTFICSDTDSGIKSCTETQTATNEGQDQPVIGTAVDNAGNSQTDKASVSIDKTAPTIQASRSPAANGNGWNNTDVTVSFDCDDALSGVATCSAPKTVGEGANQSASGTAVDAAGNSSASVSISGINVDKTDPTLTGAATSGPNGNGWYNGNVTIAWTCGDALSGIDSTCPANSTVSGEGDNLGASASVSDKAGNTTSATVGGIKIDRTPPVISGAPTTNSNSNGWYSGPVKVHFTCSDALSDIASCPADVTLSANGASQSATGTAIDKAGNSASFTVGGIKIDQVKPTISGAATTSPNANGWYNGPVMVHFTCSDALSGIDNCPADATLTSNGANQSIIGTVSDKASNTASFTVSGINIDTVAPVITVTDTNGNAVNGAVYTLGAVPAISCSATDSGGASLAGSCSGTTTGGNANGVGTFTYTVTATDKAGNTTMVKAIYRVIYRFDGFLQPINDTAHQTGLATSIFKGGSTVPAKFQLKKADGTVVQASVIPTWVPVLKGSSTSAAVDEGLYSDPATSGGTYRWDSTAQQYIYNWSTKGPAIGYYYRIGVTLDDGQTYYVNIGLR